MWHDVGIGVGQRRGRLGGSPLSISAPGAYIDLTTNFPLSVTTDITFADTEESTGDYEFTLTVTNGTFTLGSIPAGLSLTTGTGTADALMVFDCTEAEFNTAMTNGTLNSFSDEDGQMTIASVRALDSLAGPTKTILVLALPALTATNIIETLEVGSSVFPGLTTALSGSSAVITLPTPPTVYDRPTLSGLILTDNADGTMGIDYNVDDFGTAGTAVDLYYVVSTSATFPSGQTTQALSSDYLLSGFDMNGDAVAVVEDNNAAPVAISSTGAQTTITSGALGAGTFYVLLCAVSDATDQASDALHSIVSVGSVVVTTGGTAGQPIGLLLALTKAA